MKVAFWLLIPAIAKAGDSSSFIFIHLVRMLSESPLVEYLEISDVLSVRQVSLPHAKADELEKIISDKQKDLIIARSLD
jgi:hypothetical protein